MRTLYINNIHVGYTVLLLRVTHTMRDTSYCIVSSYNISCSQKGLYANLLRYLATTLYFIGIHHDRCNLRQETENI